MGKSPLSLKFKKSSQGEEPHPLETQAKEPGLEAVMVRGLLNKLEDLRSNPDRQTKRGETERESRQEDRHSIDFLTEGVARDRMSTTKYLTHST